MEFDAGRDGSFDTGCPSFLPNMFGIGMNGGMPIMNGGGMPACPFAPGIPPGIAPSSPLKLGGIDPLAIKSLINFDGLNSARNLSCFEHSSSDSCVMGWPLYDATWFTSRPVVCVKIGTDGCWVPATGSSLGFSSTATGFDSDDPMMNSTSESESSSSLELSPLASAAGWASLASSCAPSLASIVVSDCCASFSCADPYKNSSSSMGEV
ncbi:hypothetical protein OGAPHI_005266 [Ogataea philodendri]|uniref:Uncharacterized protein n=1 Tax=Ogataea philodendri TaxID=1378263 RepID=A0A9P8P115_9ASCO|nr:uncharacterized protein OGAPHI_005266 [Ogataea philodendri]KAH3663863.1 hypothetical protein OGAPHI_005266 [Ogataea philodendri]